MKAAVALAFSVVANVALGVAAAKLLRTPSPASAPLMTQATALSQSEIACVVTDLPPTTTFITNRFDWQRLVSTNYDEFVANLRAVGCPEGTIRDIIVGDVWRTFAAFDSQLDPAPFWANGPRWVAERRRREAERLRWVNDISANLRRLFGYEWSPHLRRDLFEEENLACRLLLGDVSEDQLERATALILSVESLKEEVTSKCGGIFLPEDYAELRRRRDELEQRVRAVLSPAQFEEFSARAGIVEWLFDGDRLKCLKPSATELRQIMLAGTQVRPLGWKMVGLDNSLTEEEQEADEAAVQQRIRQILGEARFAEFELLKDGNYRSIHAFAEKNNLPLDTAHKLYEMRKLAAEEIRQVRQENPLDSQTRTQRLQAVAQSLTPAVQTLLGPKLFADYLRHSGQWVTNLNQL